MRNFNVCTASDSYKFKHWTMYPRNTTKVYSYFESRKGAKYDYTIFFSLQYMLKEYFTGVVVTREKIDRAKKRINAHLGNPNAFNEAGWEYILKEHGGILPVRIKAAPEGMVINTGNVLMIVENTDPKCGWLTSYLETMLTHVWSASTVATISYNAKKIFKRYLDKTSDNPEVIDFMLHDFGFRGASSFETAYVDSAGHLINFKGTDTFPAVEMTMDYYNQEEVTAFSVAATEHSIMTARGEEGEMEVLGELLEDNPTGILSVVIDSYDYCRFIREVYCLYGDQILTRDGKLVFRPDSGSPNEVTLEVYELLEELFGSTENSKGYKVLNPKVGILWGDGIDVRDADGILFMLEMRGISAETMVFGMGSGLTQKINRDIQRFAFKSSYQERDGIGYDIFKSPLDVSKQSKRGQLMLIKDADGNYKTINVKDAKEFDVDLLEPVFENGVLLRDMSFDEVRANAM